MPTASLSALLDSLPPEPAIAPRRCPRKLVVLDDDPTGTQTVNGVPVFTVWTREALVEGLRDNGPCFYVLTNTRAFTAERACAINREIGRNLAAASRETGIDYSIVSRGDSTLRGHFPAETDALAWALAADFDATLIIPAFFAGGRLTIGDVHYVADGDRLTPAGETEFARDASFGYRNSNLRNWVEEKTGGRVPAAAIVSVSLDDLRRGGPVAVETRLRAVPMGGVAVVNAAASGDLAILTHALAALESGGRRYLFRTAADFVAAYSAIPRRPILEGREIADASSSSGGLLVAGSYVGKTSAQLEALFESVPSIARVEVMVDKLLAPAERDSEVGRCAASLAVLLGVGRDAALYTSRNLRTGSTPEQSLAIGTAVSAGLVEIIGRLPIRPRWLIAKGGITSSDIATQALRVRRATVLGQALPGVPVWQLGEESRWPGLAYVIFPGNVGGPKALADLVGKLVRNS